ncbi:uncharacterized protein PpBr36_09747 [Pyricularia pennisetigena]|uniref:uncharacterized protein n=1 Tax=Pyricularia pennisetigena TaxID=1578925 RepID=UPI00114E5AEF|nr:uncharacterized protein PpBr36_09747 [Pyricularia pennisetigena]TLS22488.1 hypothetical protein PpBr36_09747 [Pyricularia pennisetigena]
MAASNIGQVQKGLIALAGVAALATLLASRQQQTKQPWLDGPSKTLLPELSDKDAEALPYPPDALPGRRDVPTPYGVIRVFEWGPEDGERVLFLHGISTPCVALGSMAAELVDMGKCRVILFDLFGRGYSDAPSDLPYDMRLYTTQILLVLASSHLPWTGDEGFHLIGYSFGGGISVPFATFFPHMVRSLILVAGCGLIRESHVGWWSKLLYSSGWLPEGLLQRLVKSRLTPQKPGPNNDQQNSVLKEEVVTEADKAPPQDLEVRPQGNSDASGGESFDRAVLPGGATVSSVMNWQLQHHSGFVPAFMSTIRHAPIYEEWGHWRRLGSLLAERRVVGGPTPRGLVGGKVLLVLGRNDPVIVKEELVHDAAEALGQNGFEAAVLEGGHEVPLSKGHDVAREIIRFWEDTRATDAVLHLDPNNFYGGPEAALTLQEAEEWARTHSSQEQSPSGDPSRSPASSTFASASVTRPQHGDEATGGLSSHRAYSLALAPHIIHARSRLVEQLVSSRAFRQLEFLAVGSFFVLSCSSSQDTANPLKLTRIPSTREDVFSDSSIPVRAKRSLMKFLKFVLDYNSDPHTEIWQAEADSPFAGFLETKFKLDKDLQAYVLTLTLAPDGNAITTRYGLAAIHRHLTSMGYFGPGFAAVYPKWGGASEIAQVACRSGAVGGGVYMLGTGIKDIKPAESDESEVDALSIELSNETVVRTKLLVRGMENRPEVPSDTAQATDRQSLSRLVAVVNSPLSSLFETVVEGAPLPAVAVIACAPATLNGIGDIGSQEYPVYMIVHSSDTGECPSGQSLLYLSTQSTAGSQKMLQQSIEPILASVASLSGTSPPRCLWSLSYEQTRETSSTRIDGKVVTVPGVPLTLALGDDTLDPVFEAWKVVMGEDVDQESYMKFADREGMGDEDHDM